MPQRRRGAHHLLDRRRAVRPVRMKMQVTPQRRPNTTATEILRSRAQLDQGLGLAPGPGLVDHLRGLRPDARQRLPAVGPAVPLALRFVEALDDVGGVAIGHYPPRVLPGPVFVVGDLSQRGYRIHLSSVPARLEELPDDEPGE